MFEIVVGLALAAIVAFQIWLTVSVFRCPAYERAQKVRQAQLIWLLPILGATLVFTILRDANGSDLGPQIEAPRGAKGRAPKTPRA